jgi:hypothetical protein
MVNLSSSSKLIGSTVTWGATFSSQMSLQPCEEGPTAAFCVKYKIVHQT